MSMYPICISGKNLIGISQKEVMQKIIAVTKMEMLETPVGNFGRLYQTWGSNWLTLFAQANDIYFGL